VALKKNTEVNYFNLLCWSAFLITVILTPWANSDSLIIPKLIVLFCIALFFLPLIVTLWRNISKNKVGKILIALSMLIIIQLIAVIFTSGAPFEQQFFGRTGRGLGFATEFSLIVILLAATLFIRAEKVAILQISLVLACFVTSTYSVLQRFGFDIFDWTTRTNGIIGTLGNPNFQSSFAAMSILPAIAYFWSSKMGKILSVLAITPLVGLIYISQSTQGYITALTGISVFSLIFLWYRKRVVFYPVLILFVVSGIIAISGMLNKGPLSTYLYKISVQSRGDFFRTSARIANENPLFGIGLDSLGDNYLKYIDAKTASGIGEFADNSHNLFLHYASTGGYTLAILQLAIVVLVLYCFYRAQKDSGSFNKNTASLFCAWVCYQQQTLISPANISMLAWNAIISGAIIGLSFQSNQKNGESVKIDFKKLSFVRPFSYFALILGIILTYPYYKVDNMQVRANQTGDANLAMQSALTYPKASVRFSRIGEALLKSNLLPQSLEIARAAVKFNPNAPAAWGLILVNDSAPPEERERAMKEIFRLDPFNKELRGFVIKDTTTP